MALSDAILSISPKSSVPIRIEITSFSDFFGNKIVLHVLPPSNIIYISIIIQNGKICIYYIYKYTNNYNLTYHFTTLYDTYLLNITIITTIII